MFCFSYCTTKTFTLYVDVWNENSTQHGNWIWHLVVLKRKTVSVIRVEPFMIISWLYVTYTCYCWQIFTLKGELLKEFSKHDKKNAGQISVVEWCDSMKLTTGLDLPWRMLREKLVKTTTKNKVRQKPRPKTRHDKNYIQKQGATKLCPKTRYSKNYIQKQGKTKTTSNNALRRKYGKISERQLKDSDKHCSIIFKLASTNKAKLIVYYNTSRKLFLLNQTKSGEFWLIFR